MKCRRYCSPIEALHSPSGGPHRPLLFNSQRNNQQPALPLPATGDQTAPKGCPRQGEPCTADRERKARTVTPSRYERPGKQCAPPPRR